MNFAGITVILSSRIKIQLVIWKNLLYTVFVERFQKHSDVSVRKIHEMKTNFKQLTSHKKKDIVSCRKIPYNKSRITVVHIFLLGNAMQERRTQYCVMPKHF